LNWELSDPSRAQVAFRFAALLLSGRRYAENIEDMEDNQNLLLT